MEKVRKCFSILLISILLTGCVKREVVDDIYLVEGIGFDGGEKGELTGTVMIPVFLKDKPPENLTLTGSGSVTKSILQNIQREAAFPISMGGLGVILFERKLAENGGILHLVDAFQRDPAVGTGIIIAITERPTKEIFSGHYGIRGNANHISHLIKHNIKVDDLPTTNFQRFLADFYQNGKSPYLPIIDKITDEDLRITGIAFIRYGYVVDSIEMKDAFFLKLLVDKYSNGLKRVKIEEGEAAVRNIRSKHKLKLVNRNPYEVHIEINVEGIINEFTGNKITPEIMEKLEKQFMNDIEKECMKLVNRFKEKDIDPIGIGHFVKSRTRHFDFDKWMKEEYKNLIVRVIPNVRIAESGVIQ